MAFVNTLVLLVVLVAMAGLIVTSLTKVQSGLKVMVLGVHITLLGGIIAVDPSSSLGGIEYLVALAGLMVSIAGLRKESGSR